jgi:HK97 family phage major capsid protein
MDERLKRLIARREQAATEKRRLLESRKAIVDLAKEEAREDLSTEEDIEFRKLSETIKTWDEELAQFDERIAELTAEMERDAKVTEGAAAVRRAQARLNSVTESATYVKGNGRSYLKDLSRVQLNLDGSGESRARLERHAIDVSTMPEYRAGLDRVDGTGGFFVPPIHLVDQFVGLARAQRATADLVSQQQLPAGTDSINIPKLATGTAVAIQTADNAAVQETDATDALVTLPVRTIAGQATIAQQLLDQSPVNFDQIIFADLAAAYNTEVDKQVISGSGASGQVKGITAATGIIAITYTSTAPTVQALYGVLNDATQRVHTQRFAAPTVIVMSPRRWAWIQNAFDTQGRPLVVPSGPGMNAIATANGVVSQQVVGNLLGLPVVTDPNLPTNLGAGTNQDTILVMKADDLILFESSLRTRAFPEVLSNTLSVRLQLFAYLAFTAERQPKSVVQISGTGLTPPTF